MTFHEDLATAFERRAALDAEREAVASETQRLGYRRLDRTANRLAHWILERTPPGRAPVAVIAAHDATVIAMLLAVAKAGKIALPLNVHAPLAVQRAILAEAEPQAIFTDACHAGAAAALGAPVVLDASVAPPSLPPERPDAARDPDAPAFILFTSGSTGAPNGVVMLHRNVVANIPHQARDMGLGCEDRITWLAPLHVAAAPSAIFCALLSGGCVLPFDVAARSLRELREFLEIERATILHTSPSLFRSLCRALPEGARLPHVRVVRLAGEPVRADDAALVAKHFHPECLLVNGFAMAEANGVVCSYAVKPDDVRGRAVVPVGRPVPGVRVHLLDDAGHPVAAGEAGEIVVESDRLAPCYWKRPALDAERFVRAGSGWRFHTRDLGRELSDGTIAHLGRKDDQVKVRGHRVRLDGVEVVLLADPEVRQACVTAVETEPDRVMLVAHVVPRCAEGFDALALRQRLRERLPPYAVPARIEVHGALPITPNGKVDRRGLARLAAQPPAAQAGVASEGRAARIAEIWSRRLARRCAIDDASFFDLGGDSLSALEMLSEVEEVFGVDVRLSDFMEAPDVASLAHAVEVALRAGRQRALPAFVPVGPGRSGRRLFVAPGAASDPSSVLEVANALPDRRFLVHSWAGMDGYETPHDSVGEMADHFLREMRAVEPEGPHLLAGLSFGGAVAFEVARRLHEEGDPPLALVIADTRLAGWLRPRGFDPRRIALRAILRRNPIGEAEETSWRSLRRGIAQRRRIRRATRRAHASIRRGRPVPHRYRYWKLLGHFAQVYRRWAPRGAYAGDATLLRAEQRPSGDLFVVDETLGWRRWIGGQLRIIDFPGNHVDFLRAPLAAEFAQRLGEVLAGFDGPSAGEIARGEPVRQATGGLR